MKGFGLWHGRKLIDISTSKQTLTRIAWYGCTGRNMPVTLLPCDIKEIEAAGYKVRPIQFARLVEDGQKGNK